MLCACYVFIMTFLAAACDMDDDEVLVERSFGVEFLVVTSFVFLPTLSIHMHINLSPSASKCALRISLIYTALTESLRIQYHNPFLKFDENTNL
jgi:hypothetical protein